MIYICRSFHNVGNFIGFLIIGCPELELESLKVGKAEKGRKAEKDRKGDFGCANSLLAKEMPQCYNISPFLPHVKSMPVARCH